MKILMLCNKSPWPPREGGPIAMNMMAEGLIEAGHEVKILAVNSFKYNIREEDIPEEYRKKTGIELVDVDLRIRPVYAFLNLFSGKSYHVERFISDTFRKRLIRVLRETSFDVVQLETVFVAPYIPDIRAHSQAKIILRAHNIEHLIWSRLTSSAKNPLKRWYLSHLTKTLKRYECNASDMVDGIVAITETDAGWFRDQVKNDRKHTVTAIPFGIDPERYKPSESSTGLLSLFSIGAMNWLPNAEGIRWFLDQVWPGLHTSFPDLIYYLAGREMPDWMKNLNLPNVRVLGEVDDAGEFIRSYGIMIVPLFSGSGIRIKIIEGMAYGKAIISTPVGAEGIDCRHGKDILLANAACEFADMVELCLTQPGKIPALGRDARTLVETRYNSRILIGNLITFYRSLNP